MSNFVLVDTDVLSGYFGRNRSLKNAPEVLHLDLLLAMDAVRVTGHVFQEVLNGIGKAQAGTYRKIKNRLKKCVFVPSRDDYDLAVEISRKSTAHGCVLSIADLMNCSISASKGWKLLAFDGDYDEANCFDSRIKRVRIE